MYKQINKTVENSDVHIQQLTLYKSRYLLLY